MSFTGSEAWAAHITARAEELLGRPMLTTEAWETSTKEEREREIAAVAAVQWLEDHGRVIKRLVSMTGESIETMTAYYFGMHAYEAARWIRGLTRADPPKEPWQS